MTKISVRNIDTIILTLTFSIIAGMASFLIPVFGALLVITVFVISGTTYYLRKKLVKYGLDYDFQILGATTVVIVILEFVYSFQ